MKSLGISVRNVRDAQAFFGSSLPSRFLMQGDVDALLLHDVSQQSRLEEACETPDIPEHVGDVLQSILDVLYYAGVNEGSVDDLSKSLMRLLGFRKLGRVSMTGPITLPLYMCGEKKYANPDVAIRFGHGGVLLLVQEDKRFTNEDALPPDPQLAAEMVAAACFNYSSDRLNPNAIPRTIYGITIMGTYCSFYRCSISEEACASITSGRERTDEIVTIYKYSPGTPLVKAFMTDSKENMLWTLRCYEGIRLLLAREISQAREPRE